MKAALQVLDLRTLIGRGELKITVILLASALLPAVQKAWGSIEFFEKIVGADGGLRAPAYMFVTAFLCMAVVPLLTIRGAFRESLRKYGLTLGDWKTGAVCVTVFAPIIGIALLYPASQTAEFQAFYPFARSAANSWTQFVIHELMRIVLFYTAWEFFFRGFILFGLKDHFGAWTAICIQVIPQCLWHIGMPTGELLSSIAGGILFGAMALRTGSILWPWLLHCFIGVCTDVMVVLTQ